MDASKRIKTMRKESKRRMKSPSPAPSPSPTPPAPPTPNRSNSLNSSLTKTYKPERPNSTAPVPTAGHTAPTTSTTPAISVRFSDVGGIEQHLQSVTEICIYPLTHPEIFTELGVKPPRGVLLHGPPGCGKTLLAHAIAGELGIPFFKISAPEIVSGMSGESEEKIRTLFIQARAAAPAIIFIDEIDAITTKRESSAKGMELRIVSQLLTCMDGDGGAGSDSTDSVMVIGATNRPDSLDPALRRAGRFDREIHLGIPDEAARARVLQVLISKMKCHSELNVQYLASKTHGFVGADLQALTKEAAILAVNRIFSGAKLADRKEPLTEEELCPLQLQQEDFNLALSKVQPSLLREGFATIPQVTWDDVGALETTKIELERNILLPLKNAQKFHDFGLAISCGVLLYGPPGCGKTLVAKAVAGSSGANFISVKGPELLNKYVGESEAAIRNVFRNARNSKPCVIFFDEFDALCPKRQSAGASAEEGVSQRVVNQLLTEMDSIEAKDSIYVIAATNRPESVDPAMIRFGRLNRLCFVSLPSALERELVFKALARKTPLGEDVSAADVVGELDGFTGADIASLLREAAMHALQHQIEGAAALVTKSDFQAVCANVRPSVSKADLLQYERTHKQLMSLVKG
ncbi:hypothetical protein BASA81_006723 [Batrachochytrium salamandrivorans]|nr:hypothetical protein BASA81_006723 [Batrachochytrium salamandrivorans]